MSIQLNVTHKIQFQTTVATVLN